MSTHAELEPGETSEARILHCLLAAGSLIGTYTNRERLLEFVAAALRAVPGTVSCGVSPEEEPGSHRSAGPAGSYRIDLRTAQGSFGHVELEIADRAAFAPYEGAVHNLVNTLAISLENLHHRGRLEALVRSQTRHLQRAVERQNLLLREIQHRNKNTLTLITSLLDLQFSRSAASPELAPAIAAFRSRVRSIAMVQEFLVVGSVDLETNLATYLGGLCEQLAASFSGRTGRVNITSEIDAVMAPAATATVLGLIVNEAVTNALKHAFPGGREGRILVRLGAESPNLMQLRVEDDGVGNRQMTQGSRTTGLGLQLIRSLVGQLGGTLTCTADAGTCVGVSFPVPTSSGDS